MSGYFTILFCNNDCMNEIFSYAIRECYIEKAKMILVKPKVQNSIIPFESIFKILDFLFFNISTHWMPKSSISYGNVVPLKKNAFHAFSYQIYNASTYNPLEFFFIKVTCIIIVDGEKRTI